MNPLFYFSSLNIDKWQNTVYSLEVVAVTDPASYILYLHIMVRCAPLTYLDFFEEALYENQPHLYYNGLIKSLGCLYVSFFYHCNEH